MDIAVIVANFDHTFAFNFNPMGHQKVPIFVMLIINSYKDNSLELITFTWALEEALLKATALVIVVSYHKYFSAFVFYFWDSNFNYLNQQSGCCIQDILAFKATIRELFEIFIIGLMLKMESEAFVDKFSKAIAVEEGTVMLMNNQNLVLLISDLRELIFPFSSQSLHFIEKILFAFQIACPLF
jgi:hypothetical protein